MPRKEPKELQFHYRRGVTHVFFALPDARVGHTESYTLYKIRLIGAKRCTTLARDVDIKRIKTIVTALIKEGA